MNNVSVPAVAATVDGSVVYVSRVFTERSKRARNELMEAGLEELTPGVQFADVLAELERTHSSIQRKSERTMLTFYPIRNGVNQLSYVVCVFQGNAGLVEQAARALAHEGADSVGRVRKFLESRWKTARRLSRGGRSTGGPPRATRVRSESEIGSAQKKRSLPRPDTA